MSTSSYNNNLLTETEAIMNSIENNIISKLGATTVDGVALIQLENQIVSKTKTKADDDVTIPSAVYNAFAEKVATQINASVEDKTTLNFVSIFKTIASSIIDSFKSIDADVVAVNGVNYRINYNPLATKSLSLIVNKIGTVSAKVTWSEGGSSHEATLKWENLSKTTLKDYVNFLKELTENTIVYAWNNVIKGAVTDVVQIVNAVKVVKALYSNGNENLLREVLGSDVIQGTVTTKVKKQIRSEIESYLKHFMNDGKQIVSTLKRYEQLNKKYDQLTAAIENGKNVEQWTKNFITAANKFETQLGLSTSALIVADDDTSGVSYDLINKTVIINDDFEGVFDLTDYNFTASTIDASSRLDDISINGGKKSEVIIGGASYDTLYGGKGNDTLFGGEGIDIFCYERGSGNDVIADYTIDDVIRLNSGEVSKVALKNSDVVFTIGTSKLTVKDAADIEIVIQGADGHENSYVNGKLTSSR